MYPGDDPKHELVLTIRRDTPRIRTHLNESEEIVYSQSDSVAGTGTGRGYLTRIFKNGDIKYGSYGGTDKTTVKEDGSTETTWEGTYKVTGGTGRFKPKAVARWGKATAEGPQRV